MMRQHTNLLQEHKAEREMPLPDELDDAIDGYITEAERWERDPEFLAELKFYAYDAEADSWDPNAYAAFMGGYALGRRQARRTRHHCRPRTASRAASSYRGVA